VARRAAVQAARPTWRRARRTSSARASITAVCGSCSIAG
jgi:hypothetical protein